MLGFADKRNRTFDSRKTKAATARTHCTSYREEALPVGKLKPLRHDLTGPREDAVHSPQGAAAAVSCKRKGSAIQSLRHVAGGIDANEEEWDSLLAGLLQGRQPMRRHQLNAQSWRLASASELSGDSLCTGLASSAKADRVQVNLTKAAGF